MLPFLPFGAVAYSESFKPVIVMPLQDIHIPQHINLNNPEFEKAGHIHDWRNYVPKDWKDNWHLLMVREREIIYTMAEAQAGVEEYD